MKIMKMKFKVKPLLLLLPVFLFAISACNQSAKDKENKSELVEEIQDVKDELDEIATKEKQELINNIELLVADFNKKVNTIESKIETGNNKLNKETQAMLDNLKAERDTLNMRLNEVENQTQAEWKSFKEEVEYDSEQFAKSVENFFQDNK